MDSNICAAVAPAVLKSVAVANGLAVFKSVTVYPAATKAVNEKAFTICAIGAPAATKSDAVADVLAAFKSSTVYPAATKAVNE